ncbi:MAG: type II toxin-antitoxin system VapC family toxin [Ardenticatenaceae bacterium]|nr:type II toxin-antitoxin system VapC family toxin [Ardenticatenaceae bacterium]
MRYLFDTNICIYLINQPDGALIQRITQLEPGEIGIPSIVTAELQYGVFNSRKVEQNHSALEQFLLPFVIVPFDHKAAEAYGRLRATLRQDGRLIGSMDMLIAAQAIATQTTLITNNEREFKRVPGLKTENWAQ